MSDPFEAPSNSERGHIVRFFHWLGSGPATRRVLFTLAMIAGLIALWYGEEDWSGRRAWNQYRQATEARGESLDPRSYIPKPVPDDQNFCATPFLKSFFQTYGNGFVTRNDLWLRADISISETNTQKDRGRRHFTDLAAWQLAFDALQNGTLKRGQFFETTNTSLADRAAAAPAVLEAMNGYAAVFAELRAASTRPYSLCPVAYDLENSFAILGRYLPGVKELCQRLNLEACAELAARHPGQALADVKLSLCLADSLKSEPRLISYLVRVSCYQILTPAVWEGLAEHRWTDAQLQELQARFMACDFLGDLDQALKGERAFGVLMCDSMRKNGLDLVADNYLLASSGEIQPPMEVIKLIGFIMPAGWYDLEKLNYCRKFDDQFKGIVDFAAKRVSPRNDPSAEGKLIEQISGSLLKATLQHRLIAATLTLGPLPAKAAVPQTIANQAALACALERYRLANGQFPETLEALAPRFISRAPNDVITGQPYKYRRAEDGQFLLYSVGWNEKDDGGAPGKTLFDKTRGDWVWSYTVK